MTNWVIWCYADSSDSEQIFLNLIIILCLFCDAVKFQKIVME